VTHKERLAEANVPRRCTDRARTRFSGGRFAPPPSSEKRDYQNQSLRLPTGGAGVCSLFVPLLLNTAFARPHQQEVSAIIAVVSGVVLALSHEDLQVGALFGWAVGPAIEVVEKYKDTLKKYPSPPAGNLTRF
jgi:hypothetical protein